MKFYTYILISKREKRTYTGHTSNLNRRVNEHNSGLVKSSKKYRPYKLLYWEESEILKIAKERERFFKSSTGRRKLRKMFFSN